MEELKEVTAALAGGYIDGGRKVDCCCPVIPVYIFKEVNCVNIFNGACEDWRPGGPCASGASGPCAG